MSPKRIDIDFSSELRGDMSPDPSEALRDPVGNQENATEDEASPYLVKELLEAHDEETPVKQLSAGQWLLGIVGAVAGTLIAAGVVSLTSISLSTARKVDVLIDRPVPVPLSQYEKDTKALADKLNKMDKRQSAMECRQQKQIYKNSGINFDCDLLSDSHP